MNSTWRKETVQEIEIKEVKHGILYFKESNRTGKLKNRPRKGMRKYIKRDI